MLICISAGKILYFNIRFTNIVFSSMSMGKSVIAKLAEIASAHFGIEAKEGQDKVTELEKNKRVIKELWG